MLKCKKSDNGAVYHRTKGAEMNDKNMRQIKEQLPVGERIVRSYKSFEGDIRLIAKGKNGVEIRYTVKWDYENNYPRIELLP